MAESSEIEWTESTWNPVTGCTKVSEGCLNCYAERMSYRLKAMGVKQYSDGFHVRVHEQSLSIPMKWKSSKLVFVNSMSDLFHEDVPLNFIKKVFEVMNSCPQHTFQILTKRSERLRELSATLNWTPNIWMGVSIENQNYFTRINDLVKCNAKIKFLSCEPLLDSLPNLPLINIDWVIVGGESGPSSRPMQSEWVVSIRDQCLRRKVPYFFKQWGGFHKKKNGRILEGKVWNQMPVSTRTPKNEKIVQN